MASGGGSGGGAGGDGIRIRIREQSNTAAPMSSSDAGVNAVSEGLANLDMTGGDGVKRLLECPICMEILASPIYQCVRGHIICNTCQPKLTKCPSCGMPVGIIRNLALESILETVSFPCSHHPAGCKEFSKIQDLQQHLEECDYRPLKCHLSDRDDCDGALLYLADTLKHLQDTHKLRTVKPQDGHSNVFRSENFIWLGGSDSSDSDESSDEDPAPAQFTWTGELFHFDENVFVALIRSIESVTYFGFYLIGPQSDASKYSVKISVQKHALEDAIFKSEVTTQFISIRDFQEVWDDFKLPHEAMVHDSVLRRDIFPGREIDEDTEWGVVYTINKI